MYEKIEQDLIYLGATAIEDKLQDGVPECIAKIAKANIKIWVLTGDKLETAINIGYSCQLLTNDMEVFTIEAKSESDLVQQLNEKKRIIDEALARNRALNSNNDANGGNNRSSFRKWTASWGRRSKEANEFTNAGAVVDNNNNMTTNTNKQFLARYSTGHLTTIPESSNITDFALVINGQSLVYALNGNCEKKFLDLCCMCKAVICCRVTPGQKKAVVDLVKTHKKAITLAIGDGANDVSMIKCKILIIIYIS